MSLLILATALAPAHADEVRLAPSSCETAIVWPKLDPDPEAALVAFVEPVEVDGAVYLQLPAGAEHHEGVAVDLRSGERIGIVAPIFDEQGIVAPIFDELGIVAPFFSEGLGIVAPIFDESVIDPVYDSGWEGVNPVPTPGATCIIWLEI